MDAIRENELIDFTPTKWEIQMNNEMVQMLWDNTNNRNDVLDLGYLFNVRDEMGHEPDEEEIYELMQECREMYSGTDYINEIFNAEDHVDDINEDPHNIDEDEIPLPELENWDFLQYPVNFNLRVGFYTRWYDSDVGSSISRSSIDPNEEAVQVTTDEEDWQSDDSNEQPEDPWALPNLDHHLPDHWRGRFE